MIWYIWITRNKLIPSKLQHHRIITFKPLDMWSRSVTLVFKYIIPSVTFTLNWSQTTASAESVVSTRTGNAVIYSNKSLALSCETILDCEDILWSSAQGRWSYRWCRRFPRIAARSDENVTRQVPEPNQQILVPSRAALSLTLDTRSARLLQQRPFRSRLYQSSETLPHRINDGAQILEEIVRACSFWRDDQRTGTIISTTPVHGLKF